MSKEDLLQQQLQEGKHPELLKSMLYLQFVYHEQRIKKRETQKLKERKAKVEVMRAVQAIKKFQNADFEFLKGELMKAQEPCDKVPEQKQLKLTPKISTTPSQQQKISLEKKSNSSSMKITPIQKKLGLQREERKITSLQQMAAR